MVSSAKAQEIVQDWRSKNNASKAEFTKAFNSGIAAGICNGQSASHIMLKKLVDQGIIQQAAMKYQSDPEFVAAMRTTGACFFLH